MIVNQKCSCYCVVTGYQRLWYYLIVLDILYYGVGALGKAHPLNCKPSPKLNFSGFHQAAFTVWIQHHQLCRLMFIVLALEKPKILIANKYQLCYFIKSIMKMVSQPTHSYKVIGSGKIAFVEVYFPFFDLCFCTVLRAFCFNVGYLRAVCIFFLCNSCGSQSGSYIHFPIF